LCNAVSGPFSGLKRRLALKISLSDRFRPSGGGGCLGNCHALLRRELFHTSLAAGFPALAADFSQVFGYLRLASHRIDAKAVSRKIQLPLDMLKLTQHNYFREY
jgi:hypothetical protein